MELSPAGILENLRWAPAERAAPGPGEVEIKVQATGLNFRDVLCALGMYPGKIGALGAECAGIVTRVGAGTEEIEPGDKVMAVARGGFGTYVTVRADHVSSLPAGVSMAEAASIPVAFLTTFYGLHRLAHLKTDDRVLIHAAAGGVGLAAVQLAQRAGAEIFATAGSPEKRHHLQTLGVTHVFDSRSLDFASEIMSRTGGRGVDIVLNSLAGEFIAKSVSVLAPGGRFLELGKRGILTREQFGEVRPDCEYYAYDLGEEALADSSLLPGLFQDLLAAFAKGELRALPLTTFSNERVVDAFRFMAQAKHIGKIVVMKPVVDGAARTSPTSLRLRDDATYLITGGLGGLGLETARWMVREGAGQVVLMGRHPPDPKTSGSARRIDSRRGPDRDRRVRCVRRSGTDCLLEPDFKVDAAAPRSRSRGRCAGRWDPRATDMVSICGCHGAKSTRSLESPSPHVVVGIGFFCAVLCRRHSHRFARTGKLRCGQRIYGRTGASSKGKGIAGLEHQLGRLG